MKLTLAEVLLRCLLPGELALPIYEPVEPGYAWVAFGRAACVYVPVEGFAVVAEAAVELPDQVGGDGELASDEVVLLQGAHKVAQGPQLEGALEGTLLLLAADPGGAQTEVAKFTGPKAPLPADGDVGGRVSCPERVAADGTDDVRSARLTHRRPSPLAGSRAALVSPFWG